MSNKIFLCTVFLFSGLFLSACGGGDSNNGPSPTPQVPAPISTISPTQTPTVTPTPPPSVTIEAFDDEWETQANRSVSENILGNDIGENLQVTELRSESNGRALLAGGSVSFMPTTDFVGSASFEYKIESDIGESDWATVTISVIVPSDNNKPTAQADEVSVYSGDVTVISPLENDSDIDGHTINLLSIGNAAHGSVTIQSDQIHYTPNNTFVGMDQFTYVIEDVFGAIATADVIVNVTLRPTLLAVDDFINTTINTAVNVNVLENDLGILNPDALSISLGSTAGPGTFEQSTPTGVIRYTPVTATEGLAELNYEINDNAGNTSQARLTIRIHQAATTYQDIDISTLEDGKATHLIDFPSTTQTKISSAYAHISSNNAAEENLVLMLKNAGTINAVDSDFVYSIHPFMSRQPELSLASFESDTNTNGQLLHFNDDELLDIQSPINIDGNHDNRNDFILVDNFSLIHLESLTTPPAIVDLSEEAIIHTASLSDYPRQMSVTGLDINNDGIDDLAVASLSSSGIPAVQIYYGPLSDYDNLFTTGVEATNGFIITDFLAVESVANLTLASGDLNNDGNDDLMIGSVHQKNISGESSGEVYILWGGNAPYSNFSINDFVNDNLDSTDRITPEGVTISWQGSELESIGGVIAVDDINADGISDLILGNSTRTHLGSGQYMLAASIVYGSSTWPNNIELSSWAQGINGYRITYNSETAGGTINSQIIYSLSTGDLNADGYAEILLQLPSEIAVVLGGSAKKPNTIDAAGISSNWPLITLSVPSKGVSPLTTLDMDNDGFDDIIITRTNNESPDSFVVYGGLEFIYQ